MHRVLCFFLFLSACNLNPKPVDDTGTSGTDTGTGTGTTTGSPMSIADIRSGGAADGDAVTVKGVVVTSPITRDGEGFFIQDPEGGPRSGLYVWYQAGLDPYVVKQGDEVTINGVISEFYDWTELAISGNDAITNTGSGTVPDPIALQSGSGVNWDDYESVLVSLNDQTVASVDSYNTGALDPAGISLDDGFQFLDFDCGGHYDSLTGVMFYSYSAYSINPRSDTDLGTYTPGPASDATIKDVQQGDICGGVNLNGLVATTDSVVNPKDNSVSFFAQDEGGGLYSGLVIYFKAGGVTVHAGDKFSVSGSATEFYDLTELNVTDASTLVVDGTGTPVAETLTAAPTDWEPYEGMLLTLQNVAATADSDKYGVVATSYTGLAMDDELTSFKAKSGDTWSSVTGVLTYSYGAWVLWPRGADDLVK